MGLPLQRPLSTCDAEIEPDGHEAIQGGKNAKIRTLNVRFRKSLTGGRVMMTAAVSAMRDDVRARAIELKRTFDNFTPDNDPHKEHGRCSTAPIIQVTQKRQHASSRSCSRKNTEDADFLWGSGRQSVRISRRTWSRLRADLRITDNPHAVPAQYLASWLAVLKADTKAIFAAA